MLDNSLKPLLEGPYSCRIFHQRILRTCWNLKPGKLRLELAKLQKSSRETSTSTQIIPFRQTQTLSATALTLQHSAHRTVMRATKLHDLHMRVISSMGIKKLIYFSPDLLTRGL